jgi:hypothetical protein
MTDDPFAALATKTAAPAKKPAAKKETPVTAKPTAPADAAPIDYTEMDVEAATAAFLAQFGEGFSFDDAEEFEAPTAYKPYVKPENYEWVPVKIVDVEVEVKEMTVVIDENYPDRTAVISMPRFKMELDHASTTYGNRTKPYLLFIPVFPFTISTKRGLWKKIPGRKLLIAAKLATMGVKLKFDTQNMDATLAAIQLYADELVGKTIMAQVKHVTKPYEDVTPLRDPATGDFVYDEGGEVVKDIKVVQRTFDNLADDVAALPERWIKVDEKAYEITMNTIGRIATKPVPPNTVVQAVSEDGENISARWSGEHWALHAPAVALSAAASSDDGFKGN